MVHSLRQMHSEMPQNTGYDSFLYNPVSGKLYDPQNEADQTAVVSLPNEEGNKLITFHYNRTDKNITTQMDERDLSVSERAKTRAAWQSFLENPQSQRPSGKVIKQTQLGM